MVEEEQPLKTHADCSKCSSSSNFKIQVTLTSKYKIVLEMESPFLSHTYHRNVCIS